MSIKKIIRVLLLSLLPTSLLSSEIWYFDIGSLSGEKKIFVSLDKKVQHLNYADVLDNGIGVATFLFEDNSTIVGVNKDCYERGHFQTCRFDLEKNMTSIPIVGFLGRHENIYAEPFEWKEAELSSVDQKKNKIKFKNTNYECKKFVGSEEYIHSRCQFFFEQGDSYLGYFSKGDSVVANESFYVGEIELSDKALYRRLIIDNLHFLLVFDYDRKPSPSVEFFLYNEKTKNRVKSKIKTYTSSSFKGRRRLLDEAIQAKNKAKDPKPKGIIVEPKLPFKSTPDEKPLSVWDKLKSMFE